MINAVVDSGFWFALYNEKDEHHARAIEFMERRSANLHLVIPFPSLYETINTRFVKKGHHQLMKDALDGVVHSFVHDETYKHEALDATFDSAHISLVDMIIRMMIADVDLNIGAVVTFNPGDFADICRQRSVEIVPY